MLELETKIVLDVLHLRPVGRVDGATSQNFENTSLSLINDHSGPTIVDMSDVTFLTSAGLRSLLTIAKHLKSRSNTPIICGLQGNVRDVIIVSGFTSIFDVYSTATEAQDKLNKA